MRKLRIVFLVLMPMLLLLGACEGLEPSAGGQPESPSSPSSPEPVNPGHPVHVTGTSFSLGNGLTDPYDSLYIHFDGKIVDSTIPHNDWITDLDYYHPENRKILNDTTGPHWSLDSRHEGNADFCYTPGYENLVITFESISFTDEPAGIYYTDTTTGEIVFYKRVLGEMMDFQTTADGKYAFTYRRAYSASGDYSHSQIYVFDMPYLLSHCRL